MTSIVSRCRHGLIGMGILLLVWGGNSFRAQANPSGGSVVGGNKNATISGQGTSLTTINQTSANAFINWTSFNIAAGETTTFNQPSSSSVTWNYINDPNAPAASSINGNINANGFVVLQNPNGFTINGSATITAHGLVMTTASTPTLNLSSGGPWSFNAPPPTIKIVNHGQINITGGGSAFLIAADIENGIDPLTQKPGTISAPGGNIGLYAGQTVLVSTAPDGRGLSAQVTLPQGSVDNAGNLIADAGSIAAQAQFVNQNGLIQANSAQNVNGTIELVANDTLSLNAGSVISAMGSSPTASAGGVNLQAGNIVNNNNSQVVADGSSIRIQAPTVNQNGTLQANSIGSAIGAVEMAASASLNLENNSIISAQGDTQGTSSGGSVTIQSDNSFSDQSGSVINVAGGVQGGNGGQVTISATQMTAVNSSINGQAGAGYANGSLSIDTADIFLNGNGNPVAGALALNVNSWSSGFSQINLQAANNIELGSQWILGNPGTVSLLAGNMVTVDSGAKIEADAGKIILSAPTVNQNGTLQANSIGTANGVVEIDAITSLNLGAGSVISANGQPNLTTPSPGGFVVLHADNLFSDTSGSQINVAGGTGTGGGQNGIIEIFGNGVTAGTVQSIISSYYAYLINPGDIYLSSSAPTTAATQPADSSHPNPYANLNLGKLTPNVGNVGELSAYSQIDLQALNNIELDSLWTLADPGAAAALSLTAGNNITLNNSINAKNNWSINLTAGTQLPSGTLPTAGNDGIYLNGVSYIQTQNGNISLFAPNEVIVGGGAVRTLKGGSISVTTEYHNVNSGNNPNGYTFGQSAAPYYVVDTAHLGGISTAAGGNVMITAGGDVISYLPIQSDYLDPAADKLTFDGGTGAFGAQPGNVAITAGGSVYGHYVLANGVGTITANGKNGNIGAPVSVLANDSTEGFALSLIKGAWGVYAPNGSIYVQDVRNPNGIFGEKQGYTAVNYAGYHYFDYDSFSSVLFDAGNSVEITGYDAPHSSPSGDDIPMILPPTLQVITGSGDFVLDTSVILFPSPNQNLNLAIGGNFGIPNSEPVNLEMSDSASSRWTRQYDFGTSDHAAATPPELNNPNPVEISVSGNLEDVNLYTTKETHMTVGGNMDNSGFVGENLHAGDATSINVTGYIKNSPLYSFAPLSSTIDSANPFQPGLWDSIFLLAVDPSALVVNTKTGLTPLDSFDANHPPGGITLQAYLHSKGYLLFGGGDSGVYGANPGFIYDSLSLQLGINGPMSGVLSPSQIAALEGGTITVLVADSHGTPIKDSSGHLQVTTYNFNWGPAVASLASESQHAISTPDLGFQIGGPGQFNIHAASMDLGNSPGIISDGFGGGYSSLQGVTGTLGSGGAAINLNVDGDLNLITSAIDSMDGGNVSVNAGGKINLCQGGFDFATTACYGIYTSGHSDVSVTANGDINIGSGCIATFNGGNAFVESFNGNVNAGNGANKALRIYGIYFSQNTGLPIWNTFGNLTDVASLVLNPAPYGSGILAEYPTLAYQTPGGSGQPGDIKVLTPNGSIVSSRGGISQFALNGSIAGGPAVTLIAGTENVPATPPVGNDPGEGNISLGQGGVVGGTVNITAQGDVSGLIVSRQNANINTPQNFNGTVLSGGSANFTGAGNVSGLVVGIGGINVSGGATVTAALLSQNVSVGGGAAESTLATSANATSASQSAAQQSDSDAKQQLASNDNDDDQKKKKKTSELQRIKRVTVILPKA